MIVQSLPEFVMLFFVYSNLGWAMETIYMGIREHHLTNRGFLMGPYCPIYGIGLVGITTLFQSSPYGYWISFFSIIFFCSVLEYLVSVLMEHIFHTRWWDYHDMKFNIKGRICLETMIPFGVLGTFALFRMNPFFLKIYHSIPTNISNKVLMLATFIFIIDFIISVKIIHRLSLPNSEEDHTSEITKRVRETLIKYFE